MDRKGFVGGPFQLLISIIVFSMALVIGAYLFDMINCWKCNELFHIQVVELKESIASVGKSDTHSKDNVMVDLGELSHCAKGIYLKQFEGEDTCRSVCPSHPNSCWMILSDHTCGDTGLKWEGCIDIAGDTVIEAPALGVLDYDPEHPVTEEAYAFDRTLLVKVEKTGPNTILIDYPD